VTLSGFIGKPEYAKKNRGEQFFFVNNRFIRSPYLHHAVQAGFGDLIPKDSVASYVLYMQTDPKTIDINIHPTKTEVKFENEKFIYAILLSAVRKSLGKHNIAPSMDFEQSIAFNIPLKPEGDIKPPTIKVNPEYNPFQSSEETGREKSNKENWDKLFEQPNVNADLSSHPHITNQEAIENESNLFKDRGTSFQLNHSYILAPIKSGLMIIDQQNAHERILYERFLYALKENKSMSQKQLFSQTVEFSPADFQIVKELEEEIKLLGFEIREFGKNTFVVEGIPADLIGIASGNKEPEGFLESIIDEYKQNLGDAKFEKRDNLARSLARKSSVKRGVKLQQEEMNNLIDELFACDMPYYTPNGNPVVSTITLDELEKKFKK